MNSTGNTFIVFGSLAINQANSVVYMTFHQLDNNILQHDLLYFDYNVL